jgi:hypothetical protein
MSPTIGDDIIIHVGYATAHCAIATNTVAAVIVSETDKAFKLESFSDGGKAINSWFPKKAFCKIVYVSEIQAFSCKLAKWFKPEGWNRTFLDKTGRISMISA